MEITTWQSLHIIWRYFRPGKRELTLGRDIINLMFSCLDQLKIRIAKHKKDEIYEIDIDKYISTLNNLLNASVHVQDMSQTEDEGKII